MSRSLDVRTLRVCIDEYSEIVFKGRVYGSMFSQVVTFNDVSDFLVKLDELFDKEGHIQAADNKRSFRKEKSEQKYAFDSQIKTPFKEVIQQTGKYNTYNVLISQRDNSSWQGGVFSEDRQAVTYFNSELELIKILTQKA